MVRIGCHHVLCDFLSSFNIVIVSTNDSLIPSTGLYKDVAAKPSGPFPVHLAQVSLANPSVVNISVLLCPMWECPECSYNTSCPATLNYA